MTDWVPWFRYQLQASADGFVWAFSQVSPNFLDSVPPDDYFGSWPAVRHVWHVTEYERCLVIPSMNQWLGAPIPGEHAWPDNDETWASVQHRGLEELSAAFRQVRQQQMDLLDQLVDVDWNAPRKTLWGYKPLSMIVTKTFQHTYEHGDTLLRMAIWWH